MTVLDVKCNGEYRGDEAAYSNNGCDVGCSNRNDGSSGGRRPNIDHVPHGGGVRGQRRSAFPTITEGHPCAEGTYAIDPNDDDTPMKL